MNKNDIEMLFKQNYKTLIPVFLLGLLTGIMLYAFFSSACKSRDQLCKLDIKEITLLRTTLKKQELKCLETTDVAIKKVRSAEKRKYTEKRNRIEEACNVLDCAQCKR
jgi:hypothetical protein